VRPAERRTWSAEQLAAFLEASRDDRLHALWHLLALTGLRRGEALALTWDDVDLEAGSLSVRRALIPNGCSLFINIGTTTEEVASALTSHEDLLVITNNLNVAMLLYRHPRIEVIVAGGAVRRADGAVIGSTAISLIGQFKVDYAIIGASAIDEEGALLDFDYREVQAAQAIIANARSVMLVADSTKLRRSAPVRIAHLSQIQTFVTDAALPAGLAHICHSRGIEVIEAMPKPSADIDEPGVEAPSTVTRLR